MPNNNPYTFNTKVRDAILKFIREYHANHGRPPSYREIGNSVGLGTGTTHYYLHRLEAEGKIEITRDIARGIRVIERKPSPQEQLESMKRWLAIMKDAGATAERLEIERAHIQRLEADMAKEA